MVSSEPGAAGESGEMGAYDTILSSLEQCFPQRNRMQATHVLYNFAIEIFKKKKKTANWASSGGSRL